ncbi:proton channel OtopLc-like [Paramacrobiotus metropolitanus]|uniref:proton channel OtopLc-like n=1 Tax=Paramacrobiotus metropolitanus TaxID=2943436 RepID=UPI002445F389|nr:proton channel OtopLc-like [Paramacrobiotus metropolitanus]
MAQQRSNRLPEDADEEGMLSRVPFDSTESLFTDRTAYSHRSSVDPLDYDQPATRRQLAALRQLPECEGTGRQRMMCDSQATLSVGECLGNGHDRTLYDDPLEHNIPHEDDDEWKSDVAQPMAALYALLIIISNIALSVSAQARKDNHIPITYSKWFDAALYGLSILYLVYAMIFLFRVKKLTNGNGGFFLWRPFRFLRKGITTSDHDFSASHNSSYQNFPHPVARTKSSVYLKVNAIICGIGAMIFSCLEFGVFISNRRCYEVIVGVIPLMNLTFVALQTYFIFLYSKHVIYRSVILSRFGLMHLVATDITIWLRVLIDQTLYEFTVYRSQQEKTQNGTEEHTVPFGQVHMNLYYRSVDRKFNGIDGFSTLSSPACLQSESVLAGVLVNASVFLYPCIIGYAVISAGIIYIMYRNISTTERSSPPRYKRRSSDVDHQHIATWQRHQLTGRWCSYCNVLSTKGGPTQRLYWLDCDQAVGGLLTGSVVFALTIVCLILFFVFKNRNPELALIAAQIGETILYCLGIGATIIAFVEAARKLPKNVGCRVSWELDTAMLLISVVGVYAFSVLSIIGSNDDAPGIPINTILMIVTQTLAIVQATLQTIYIFEVSHRSIAHTPVSLSHGALDHMDASRRVGKIQKPGRNALTFLIVINISFWNMNIFKTLRSEASPLQRDFFGVYEWTIITHVTVPLTLLYRFHSAAGLFEIWKHAYKIKHPVGGAGAPVPAISAHPSATSIAGPSTTETLNQDGSQSSSVLGTAQRKGRHPPDARFPALDLDYSSNWQRIGNDHSSSRL